MKMMMPITPHEWVHHVEDLEQQIVTREKKMTQLESKITVLEATIERYQAQLRQSRQARFGPSQERSDQIQLAFNEAEAIAPDALAPSEAETPDEVGDTVTYQRKKSAGNARPISPIYRSSALSIRCQRARRVPFVISPSML